MNERIQIGLRVTDTMNERLEELSSRWGVSKNAAINVLLDIGMRTCFASTDPTEPRSAREIPRIAE
jgi:hypothetical protein